MKISTKQQEKTGFPNCRKTRKGSVFAKRKAGARILHKFIRKKCTQSVHLKLIHEKRTEWRGNARRTNRFLQRGKQEHGFYTNS
jgi:hypothetical protein